MWGTDRQKDGRGADGQREEGRGNGRGDGGW